MIDEDEGRARRLLFNQGCWINYRKGCCRIVVSSEDRCFPVQVPGEKDWHLQHRVIYTKEEVSWNLRLE